MVDYNKYQDVTYNQIDMMKHTIGFDDRKVKGTKYRKYEPYRNYYNAGERDKAELDKLVEIGFMKKAVKIIIMLPMTERHLFIMLLVFKFYRI